MNQMRSTLSTKSLPSLSLKLSQIGSRHLHNGAFQPSLLLNEEKKGILKTILHGTQPGASILEQEKNTFSKLLARGKYIHKIEIHHVKPEFQGEYAKLLASYYPEHLKAFGDDGLKLCGSWLSHIGELDKAVHIWEYNGYSSYDMINEKKATNKAYQNYLNLLRPMLNKRENQICLEFAFWATSPPKFHGGIYELRSYLLKPGRLLEWEQNWKVGLECRRKFTEPVGAWFSQLGDLNYVHHMWVYPNLQKRKETREEAWKVDGWSETVYNTVRLIERMQATILLPMEHSPLK